MNDICDLVTIRGTLRVRYVRGRYGDFPVGELETAIGTFAVRDSKDNAWLETLEAGEYLGDFEISELSLYSYKSFGELRTSIRAEIAAYHFDGYDDEVEQTPQLAQDPLEEEEGAIPDSFSRDTLSSVDDSDDEDDSGENPHVVLLASFDEDWRYGDAYRIDTTIGRANIVQCRNALTALGYRFDAPSQHWYLSDDGGGA